MLVLMVFAVAIALVQGWAFRWAGEKTSFSQLSSQRMMMLDLASIGVVFGLTSGAIWIASCIGKPWIQFFVRVLIVGVAAMLLNFLGTNDWLRHLSNIGGLGLAQCVVFLLFHIPKWTTKRAGEAISDQRSRQFRLSDLIMATACAAALLTAIRHYATPVAEVDYWTITVAIWGLGPLMAASVNYAFLDHRRLRRVTMALAAVSFAVLGGLGLGLAQAKFDPANLRALVDGKPPSVTFQDAAPFYLAFMIGYLLALAIVAFSGAYQTRLGYNSASTTKTRNDRAK
ncbi:hypothetical protein Poly51_31570 [Rubripirellula tenax]|uniref:Uncharacterized protein n=2 Tax=Rubripirellula tenax TaxID=2528015 RepID=A0A5C6EZ53_9BACT|nr:hypothetical protein Poly51_31570 [Rubripirellula tenax]